MKNSGLGFFSREKPECSPSIEKEVVLNNRVKKSVFFLILLIISAQINSLLLILYYNHMVSMDVYFKVLNGTMILSIVSGFFILPYQMKHYGFNLDGWRYNVKWGLIFGSLGLLVAVVGRVVLFQMGYKEFDILFRFRSRDLEYPMTVILQEVFFRGFFQSYLFAALDGLPRKKMWIFLIVAFLFAQFHLIWGPFFYLLAFGLSILLSLFYEKTRSVLGVMILHYLAGVGMFIFSHI